MESRDGAVLPDGPGVLMRGRAADTTHDGVLGLRVPRLRRCGNETPPHPHPPQPHPDDSAHAGARRLGACGGGRKPLSASGAARGGGGGRCGGGGTTDPDPRRYLAGLVGDGCRNEQPTPPAPAHTGTFARSAHAHGGAPTRPPPGTSTPTRGLGPHAPPHVTQPPDLSEYKP